MDPRLNRKLAKAVSGSLFEIDPAWVPRLDALPDIAPMLNEMNGFQWFEYSSLSGTRVQNVSKVGSQFLRNNV